ncbi:MupA/Atu3671 family FMN-dependent luciferase-like monooxygenase [Streptomyces sp. NPDC052396]|uniref:MupA/Atu3671 family FMN-dependent luciferase-like monooxygenase n=1 Tax=Streptomyces sp. NPDC052396 TaxID=3365689 RepID=UPI0037D477B7
MRENQDDIDFGLFFFAAVGDQSAATYRLMLDSAREADRLGFSFVSTPERHFHRFGGAFPNPAVSCAAIAAVTEHVQVRAGSVITPLHPTARVVEDFAMVDGISGGRVGISVGSGWNVNDFVLAKDEFETRRERMVKDIHLIREVWANGKWRDTNSKGTEVELDVFPRPVQPELDIWITASRSEETFRQAGELGTNLLTHLENQDPEALAAKIAVYREARKLAGWSGPGKVTLMMHTFVADTDEEARSYATPWLKRYLLTAIDLEAKAVSSGGLMSGSKQGSDFMSAEHARARLAELGVNRYLDGRSLIGSVAHCAEVVRRVRAAGVDEIACLIDFVGEPERVVAALTPLAEVHRMAAADRS